MAGGSASHARAIASAAARWQKPRHSGAKRTSARRASASGRQIGADAVVVRDAGCRRGTAARRPRASRARTARRMPARGTIAGSSSANSALRQGSRGSAEHRRLLLDLAAAAVARRRRDGGCSRASCCAPRRRPLRANAASSDRVVHVGEHEVLPDEDAELVAGVVERVGLVDHGAADAQHVHAGVARAARALRAAAARSPRARRCRRWSSTAPRQKTGTPLTRSAKPSASRSSVDGAESDAAAVERRCRAVSTLELDRRRGTAAAPCVCGHQSADVADAQLGPTIDSLRRSRTSRSSARMLAHRERRAAMERGRRRWRARARRPATTPVAALERGLDGAVVDARRSPALRARSARHGPTGATAATSRACGPSSVVRRPAQLLLARRAWSSSAAAGAARRAPASSERKRITSSFVARSSAVTSTRAPENMLRAVEDPRAVQPDVGERGEPVEAQRAGTRRSSGARARTGSDTTSRRRRSRAGASKSQRPAASSAAATVPGTAAASQSSARRRSGGCRDPRAARHDVPARQSSRAGRGPRRCS